MDQAAAAKARRAVIEHDREGIARQDRPAQRRGHALPRRQYHLYRYKSYTDVRLVFAPEKAHRLLRRRPRQLRVPALRPRHLLLPRLRGRQAGQDRTLSEVEQGRRGRRRIGLRLRPPGPHRAGSTRWPTWSILRDVAVSAHARPAPPPRSDAADLCRTQLRESPPRPGRAVRLSEQPQGAAGRPGRPAGPGNHERQAGRGAKTARSRRTRIPS